MLPRPFHVLLVDDDPDRRAQIRASLAAVPDLHITDVPDAETLDRLLTAGQPCDAALVSLTFGGLATGQAALRVQTALPDAVLVLLVSEAEVDAAAEIVAGMAAYVFPRLECYFPLLRCTVENIIRQHQARAALRESEERFKRLADNAPDMIFRWSYARGFEYVSPASTDVIGYTPEEHYADPGLGYRSIHLDDLPTYESVFSDLADPEGPRRYCVIRWIHRDGHTVHVEMRMTPIFDERGNLTAIEGIARDISQHVIARARLSELSARLTRAHEQERRRIARELHDEIGQMLTVAKMRLRMIENALPEEAGVAHDRLNALGELIDETLQTVRALSHELRPPLLDEMGWEPALASLCESFSQRTGLPVTFTCEGPADRLDPQVELAIYRVVQEALTNIARHAGAQHAVVQAQVSGGTLTVTVEDDGAGFSLDALARTDRPGTGLGLLGMQERVDTVGGHLVIDTSPGRGTRIRVSLPIGG